ncbi:hypothetical protein DFH94DRAFT_474769 [Russula ochroleuca]|uniref:RlpA-like protein double-psi beta-barrel domain-containing protein n=1 Tax=Russula ochroleuca TaxID=152965 RepID=A0A9P5MWK7_9AGAM|nr:hypothetical protein DFH94DRAFT_474769 [Russula ochroleuca]
MYKLTLVPLFALFSLISAIPEQLPDKIDKLEKRKPYNGEGLLYFPSVVNASGTLNACGGTNSDSDRVAAIPSAVFDESYCGKKVKIQRGDGYGEPIGATIVDQLECDGCGPSDLGLSPALWINFTSFNEAMNPINITWSV